MLMAQEPSGVSVEGPGLEMEVDSLPKAPAIRYPSVLPGLYSDPLPHSLYTPQGYESPAERALRQNILASRNVKASMLQNIGPQTIPVLPKPYYPLVMAAGLFLSAPFSIPFGYVPVMNQSNPFAIALVPGWKPDADADKYSPENFPQCISLEYDFATGTYKQKMVDWNTYLSNGTFGTSLGSMNTKEVPKVPVTPVERRMQGM